MKSSERERRLNETLDCNDKTQLKFSPVSLSYTTLLEQTPSNAGMGIFALFKSRLEALPLRPVFGTLVRLVHERIQMIGTTCTEQCVCPLANKLEYFVCFCGSCQDARFDSKLL